MLRTLRAVAHLAIVLYFVRYMDSIRLYDQMHRAFQFTIFTMHAAPLVTLRLLLEPTHPRTALALGACWTLVSLGCRRWRLQPWSATFALVEIAALTAEVGNLGEGVWKGR